jgi:hypothetical protein
MPGNQNGTCPEENRIGLFVFLQVQFELWAGPIWDGFFVWPAKAANEIGQQLMCFVSTSE